MKYVLTETINLYHVIEVEDDDFDIDELLKNLNANALSCGSTPAKKNLCTELKMELMNQDTEIELYPIESGYETTQFDITDEF